MGFKVNDPCWIWKGGYLIHEYVAMVDEYHILTRSSYSFRSKDQVFKTLDEGIAWMENCLKIMKGDNQ